MMVAQSREEEVEERGELVFGNQEKRLKPLPDSKPLKCPRCDSTNTKFCYYNNYSLSQPRYFCKGCRRYWTQGGSLRNVPVGGGCRKNKRSSPSTTSSTSSSSNLASAAAAAATACNNNAGQFLQHHPTYEYDPSDLSLAFGRLHTPINPPPPPPPLHPTTHYEYEPFVIDNNSNANPIIHHSPSVPGFLDILRGGFFDPCAIAAAGHTNFFYGLGLGGNVEGEEESLPFLPIGEICSASPPVKQESLCKSSADGSGGGDKRSVLVGVQQNWQVGGVDGANNNNNTAGLDSGRDYYWSSSVSGGVGGDGGAGVWHGLVNSPMM